jgi:hypothetical protein
MGHLLVEGMQGLFQELALLVLMDIHHGYVHATIGTRGHLMEHPAIDTAPVAQAHRQAHILMIEVCHGHDILDVLAILGMHQMQPIGAQPAGRPGQAGKLPPGVVGIQQGSIPSRRHQHDRHVFLQRRHRPAAFLEKIAKLLQEWRPDPRWFIDLLAVEQTQQLGSLSAQGQTHPSLDPGRRLDVWPAHMDTAQPGLHRKGTLQDLSLQDGLGHRTGGHMLGKENHHAHRLEAFTQYLENARNQRVAHQGMGKIMIEFGHGTGLPAHGLTWPIGQQQAVTLGQANPLQGVEVASFQLPRTLETHPAPGSRHAGLHGSLQPHGALRTEQRLERQGAWWRRLIRMGR